MPINLERKACLALYPFSQQNDKGNGKFIQKLQFSGSGSEFMPLGERSLTDICIVCVCAYRYLYT